MTCSIALFTQPAEAKSSEIVEPNQAIQEAEWKVFEKSLSKVEKGSVSMSELLSLLAEIVAASHSLRAQLTKNNINEAVATSKLAVKLADAKCSDAQEKFIISLAASVTTMALTTAASVRMGQTKVLKDKHVMDSTSGKKMSVSDLTDKERYKMTGNLIEQRTAKFRSVEQLSQMGNSMAGNMNEILYAADVRQQEETKATKELKERFDAQLKDYIQNLTQTALALNSMLEAITKASLVTNR